MCPSPRHYRAAVALSNHASHPALCDHVSLRVPPELAAKLKGPVHIRYSEDREIGGGTIDEADRVVK